MPHVNELHEQHDPILIVSFASGDLAPDDRDHATAKSLVESCADCALLHDDVLSIAHATKALPPAVRTRDFQISPEQAAKLQPGGWRRLVAAFAAPGSIFSKQLGVGLATLGIAGLLISGLPTLSLGSSAAAPASAPQHNLTGPVDMASEAATEAGSGGGGANLGALASPPAASAAASAAAEPAASAPLYATDGGWESPRGNVDTAAASPDTVRTDGFAPGASPGATDRDVNVPATQDTTLVAPAPSPATPPSNGPSALVIVSSVLLAAGIVVLLARSVARRAAAV